MTYRQTSADAFKVTKRQKTYRFIIDSLGRSSKTVDELIVESGSTHQTISSAVSKLVQSGVVAYSPSRRATRSGAEASICVLCGSVEYAQ